MIAYEANKLYLGKKLMNIIAQQIYTSQPAENFVYKKCNSSINVFNVNEYIVKRHEYLFHLVLPYFRFANTIFTFSDISKIFVLAKTNIIIFFYCIYIEINALIKFYGEGNTNRFFLYFMHRNNLKAYS